MKPGSLVECIHKGPWKFISDGGIYPNGPKYKEICTVENIIEDSEGVWLVLVEYTDVNPFTGYRYDYEMALFREIQPPMDIEIESLISQPVEA